MKTFFSKLILLAACCLPLSILANVIVKGTVKYPNGQPVANYTVYTEIDSLPGTNNSCLQFHVKKTNPNGVFIDTLVCNTSVSKVIVWVKDCNGTIIRKELTVPTSGVVEANFVVCINGNCFANFGALSVNNPLVYNFRDSANAGSNSDSIIKFKWNFGDGKYDTTNKNPEHVYANAGYYTVCYSIKTKLGCENQFCKTIIVGNTTNYTCNASFDFNSNSSNYLAINFKDSSKVGASTDEIVKFKWSFGDGKFDTINRNPEHLFPAPGFYEVCLTIKTKKGCESKKCNVIYITNPIACYPNFEHKANALEVKLNSAPSYTALGDSIIKRIWTFGDGTALEGNNATPIHQYAKAGEYSVCLKIITKKGCTETKCKKIAVVNVAGNCVPYFYQEQVTYQAKTIRFNSTAAYTQLPNDSIIERKWTFGDGTSISGNIIEPLKTYALEGNYKVCLQLKTALGCDTKWCKEITVRGNDSTNTDVPVRIVKLYPVPVSTTLKAEIYSKFSNVNAELAIYDVYGVKKWGQSKTLLQGSSISEIPVSQLANGPYIFKVTTRYGTVSKNFYKLQ
jgi:PKD repeat protein